MLRGHMNEIGGARARAVGFGSDQDEGIWQLYWMSPVCITLEVIYLYAYMHASFGALVTIMCKVAVSTIK